MKPFVSYGQMRCSRWKRMAENTGITLFSHSTSAGCLRSYRIVIAPEGTLSAEPHLKGAEEYITVFCGQAEITVRGERGFFFPKGDSIRFNADVPHAYSNPGRTDAELSMLIFYNA